MIAARWYQTATIVQATPFSEAHADFDTVDFAFGVERVPPPVPAFGGPVLYRVRDDGLYLVTAVLSLVEAVSGGVDIAQLTLNQYASNGSLYAGPPPQTPIARVFPGLSIKPPSTMVACSISTQVRLKRHEAVSLEWFTDGESQEIGFNYTEGIDVSWIEIVRLQAGRVNR